MRREMLIATIGIISAALLSGCGGSSGPEKIPDISGVEQSLVDNRESYSVPYSEGGAFTCTQGNTMVPTACQAITTFIAGVPEKRPINGCTINPAWTKAMGHGLIYKIENSTVVMPLNESLEPVQDTEKAGEKLAAQNMTWAICQHGAGEINPTYGWRFIPDEDIKKPENAPWVVRALCVAQNVAYPAGFATNVYVNDIDKKCVEKKVGDRWVGEWENMHLGPTPLRQIEVYYPKKDFVAATTYDKPRLGRLYNGNSSGPDLFFFDSVNGSEIVRIANSFRPDLPGYKITSSYIGKSLNPINLVGLVKLSPGKKTVLRSTKDKDNIVIYKYENVQKAAERCNWDGGCGNEFDGLFFSRTSGLSSLFSQDVYVYYTKAWEFPQDKYK